MNLNQAQINEFVQGVENDLGEFIGHEFCAARLIAFVDTAKEIGLLDNDRAKRLLSDAYHLQRLVTLGRKYAGYARTPPVEVQMMILQREKVI